MSYFEKLIQLLEQKYYGDLIMAFFELLAIISGLLFARKDKIGIAFLVYLIFDFSVLLAFYSLKILTSISPKELSFYVAFFNVIISFFELLAYYYFFLKVIHNQTIRGLMKLLIIVFIIILIVFISTEFSFLTNRYSYVSDIIEIIEFLFLLLPCFIYYFELLRNSSVINLYQRPSFWIVTGIFFYSLISIPYYLVNAFFFSNQYKYFGLIGLLFFEIPFAINFIFLTKAFLCKKTLTI
jgi:hypothetical protein